MCNDGTPGGYYFIEGARPHRALQPTLTRAAACARLRAAPCGRVRAPAPRRRLRSPCPARPLTFRVRPAGSDPTSWLVYLEGGYWCWDSESCTERYQTDKFDMSSSGWKSQFAQEGIFGTDPGTNPFAGFNKIFIKYCSSDSWFGDAAASSNTFGFAFRGARIVAATLTALVEHHGLGASGQAERLLFGGCSAGGRGVLVNLDYFAQAAPPSVTVSGLLDAAGWVDVQPIIPDMLSLQMMTQDLFAFTNPVIPGDCAAQYTGSEAWKCLWPSYRLPFVKTPYFLNAAQFDAFQIMYDTNNLDSQYCCETPSEQQWTENFQTQTLSMLQNVPSNDGIYSSVCLVHCLSCNADFWQFTVNGVSLAQALQRWYQGQSVRQIGQCTGWDCTLQCSGGPWMPTNTPCQTTTNQCANSYMAPPSKPPVSLPPGMTASQAGQIAWEQQQVAQKKAAANAAGNAAWSTQKASGVDPYAKPSNPVPAAQATQAGNQAWAQQQAAQKAAAAQAAGNAAWSVQQAQAKAGGPNAAWAAQQAEQANPTPAYERSQAHASDWEATGAAEQPTQAQQVQQQEGSLSPSQQAQMQSAAGSWRAQQAQLQAFQQQEIAQVQQQCQQQCQNQIPAQVGQCMQQCQQAQQQNNGRR